MRGDNLRLASNVVLNTSFQSQPQLLKQIYGYAIQAVWTGTPSGVLKLQASCDPSSSNIVLADVVPTNWSDVSLTPITISSAGNYLWNVQGCMYNWVRLAYVDNSGGTSTAVLTSAILQSKGP